MALLKKFLSQQGIAPIPEKGASSKRLESVKALDKNKTEIGNKEIPTEEEEGETRSVKTEFDYNLKDAARLIVADKTSQRARLRQKVMANIDALKCGK